MFLHIFVALQLGQLVQTNSLCVNETFKKVQQVYMTSLGNTGANFTADCSVQCESTENCVAFTFNTVSGACVMYRDMTGTSAACITGNLYRRSQMASAPNAYNVRLVPGPASGRLEIYYQSAWGTVCDDGFTATNAGVVCRQLGLPSDNAAFQSAATYGQGTGTILLDNVRCTGDEVYLSQCCHNGWTSHNCNHGEDVGVDCQ
ncbi:putative DMBT1-like protein [Haliotis rubra]|uniref:putative DMBT1-like protein n=1 Tax=Haliotis rubra TaxID=36100 RepID=UPI001EE5EB72|nr:putative DMBT1-like protein [Haliotis rubra]